MYCSRGSRPVKQPRPLLKPYNERVSLASRKAVPFPDCPLGKADDI